MIDKTFKNMIGYRYNSYTSRSFIVIKPIGHDQILVKFLNRPNFISNTHPQFGRGYAVFGPEYILSLERESLEKLSVMELLKLLVLP